MNRSCATVPPLTTISRSLSLVQTLTRLPCRRHWSAVPSASASASTSASASASASAPAPASASTSVSAAELQFGQPVHETHPHLLKPGDITIGISAQEYANRRAALAQRMPPGGLAVLQAAPLKYRSGAVFHPYRQESNFLYLTGFNEADSLAVIQKTGSQPEDYLFHLFVQPKDPAVEQWAGPRTGVQAALDVFNADCAHEFGRAAAGLADMIRSAPSVLVDPESTPIVVGWTDKDVGKAQPLSPLMDPLRAIKSEAEVANMRRAGQISGRVITNAMRRPWDGERQLHAFLDYNFVADGCDGHAYIPVVGGGDNARIIHYVHNNALLRPDSLVLVDAGGEYGTYVTDISRTWPVSGRFSPPQRDMYQAVLNVQRRGLALCRASAGVSLEEIHQATVGWLVAELRDLGCDVTSRNLHQLFPHHVGHYVGLDVHDTPAYSRREILRTGHCVTIEPGVYVPDDDRWPVHFRGLGIRIEDSVCVQDEGPLVLTVEAVKEVVDIEALRD